MDFTAKLPHLLPALKCRCGSVAGNEVAIVAERVARVSCAHCRKKWDVIDAISVGTDKWDA